MISRTQSSFPRSSTVTRELCHVEIPVQTDDEDSPSEGSSCPPSICDYSPLAPRRRHNWTREQEETLSVLNRWYKISGPDLVEVFNAQFTAEIRGPDLDSKLTKAILSKLYSLKRQGENSDAYSAVWLETNFIDEKGWRNTRDDLEETARRIGKPLIRRLCENKELLFRKATRETESPKKRKRWEKCGGELDFGPPSNDEIDQTLRTSKKKYKLPTLPETPRRTLTAPRPSPLRTSLHKPTCSQATTLSRDDDGLDFETSSESMSRTRVLFRFYDNKSGGLNTSKGICAGAFKNNSRKVPPPADRNSKKFRNEATKHLKRVREPTPFISLYSSLKPALHRGLRSNAEASVAVIDRHAVSKSQPSGVYLAAKVINELGLRRGNYRYRGRSEWLVWGQIESKAIITTFTIAQLRHFLAAAPDVGIVLRLPEIETSENADQYNKNLANNPNQVSAACGRVIGKFLAFTGLPDSYVNNVGSKITRDWQLVGNASKPRLKKYLEGVHRELERARPDEFLSRRRRIEAICSGM